MDSIVPVLRTSYLVLCPSSFVPRTSVTSYFVPRTSVTSYLINNGYFCAVHTTMKVLKFLVFFCCLTLVFSGCKKDHRVLSSAVQRDNDELVTLPGQMYPVFAHMIYHDSIPSLNDNIKYLGS